MVVLPQSNEPPPKLSTLCFSSTLSHLPFSLVLPPASVKENPVVLLSLPHGPTLTPLLVPFSIDIRDLVGAQLEPFVHQRARGLAALTDGEHVTRTRDVRGCGHAWSRAGAQRQTKRPLPQQQPLTPILHPDLLHEYSLPTNASNALDEARAAIIHRLRIPVARERRPSCR